MWRSLTALVMLASTQVAPADTFGSGGNQIAVDFVPISGAGNPASGYGIVPNDYRISKYKVTSTFSAPTPIRMICTLPAETKAKYDTSSLKRMIANAAPWSFALKQMYLADFPGDSLWEVYGSTELGVNCVLKPHDQLRKPGSCGQPSPMVEVKLFDDDGNEVTGFGPSNTGELFVKSPSVFADYYKQHDKFEADQKHGYQTVGDIAYRDDEGFIYICDRKKDMIISGGMNIYPAEIEATLEAHPDVYEAAVFGIPDDKWGESVKAA